MTWRELELAAPEIAARGKERLDHSHVALLGTLRKDGSPRISPIEPYFAQDQLLFGAMAWSLKTRDLQRDPRCVLHSAISGPTTGEGELKLYGRAEEAGQQLRDACRDGWWTGEPSESAAVFVLRIEEATFIDWDYGRAQMTVTRWSPGLGLRQSTRSYP